MKIFMRLKDGMRHERCIGYGRPPDNCFAFDITGKNEQIMITPSLMELDDFIQQLQTLREHLTKEADGQ